MDNISQELFEALDDYLNQKLPGDKAREIEIMVEEDPMIRQCLEDMLLARSIIAMQGLEERIYSQHSINMEAVRQSGISYHQPQKVTWIHRPAWRLAAAVLVLVFIGSLLQFMTVNSESIYRNNFISYHLPLVRNPSVYSQTKLDSLYMKQNFREVVRQYHSGDSLNPRNLFLAAMANMETGHGSEAIPLFLQIQNRNQHSGEKNFEEETDFYLALAYLKTQQPEKAAALFHKIRSNNRHLFYNNISGWEMWKLNLLKLKD